MSQQLCVHFTYATTLGSYRWIQDHHGLLRFSSLSTFQTLLAGITLLLGVDFCYYWFHRIAHHSNLGWATHIVHHSSEEYNLTTALRQGALQHFFSFIFYLPLAWIGYPPIWFASMVAFNTVFQFWVHTRTIDKLPAWIEYIFNTPSHHRVHHGQNPEYLDKNHAGILIIWDRWFGTFVPEKAPVQYGITTPLHSWHPIWSQVHYFSSLWEQMQGVPRLQDKLRVWYKNPGWTPQGTPTPTASYAEKFNPIVPMTNLKWALGWFAIALLFYLPFQSVSPFLQLLFTPVVVVCLIKSASRLTHI